MGRSCENPQNIIGLKLHCIVRYSACRRKKQSAEPKLEMPPRLCSAPAPVPELQLPVLMTPSHPDLVTESTRDTDNGLNLDNSVPDNETGGPQDFRTYPEVANEVEDKDASKDCVENGANTPNFCEATEDVPDPEPARVGPPISHWELLQAVLDKQGKWRGLSAIRTDTSQNHHPCVTRSLRRQQRMSAVSVV